MPDSAKKTTKAATKKTAAKSKSATKSPTRATAATSASPRTRRPAKPATESITPVMSAESDQTNPSWLRRAGSSIASGVKTRMFWAWVAGVIVAVFIVLVIWWQWERSYVAVVGGQYIPVSVMDDQLRANYGSNGVTAVIQQQLVLQEGARQHINISDKAISAELAKIKTSSGGEASYYDQLKQLGISEDLLRYQVEVQLTREALLKDKIQVSAKEIQDYYDQNKSTVDPDGKGLTTAIKSQIQDTLKQQKLDQVTPDYLDSLQQKTHTENDLSHLSLTFNEFLAQNIWPIPQSIWNFAIGK